MADNAGWETSIICIGTATRRSCLHFGTRETLKNEIHVFGKYFSERADDISFENDRVGFRIYGPETQKRGEKAYGIDLWVKHSSEIVVDDLYRLESSKHPEIAALRKQGCSTKADSLNAKIAKSLVVGWMLTGRELQNKKIWIG